MNNMKENNQQRNKFIPPMSRMMVCDDESDDPLALHTLSGSNVISTIIYLELNREIRVLLCFGLICSHATEKISTHICDGCSSPVSTYLIAC